MIRIDMGKAFDPQKQNVLFCWVFNEKGTLPRNPNEFDLAEDMEALDSLKMNLKSSKRRKIESK